MELSKAQMARVSLVVFTLQVHSGTAVRIKPSYLHP